MAFIARTACWPSRLSSFTRRSPAVVFAAWARARSNVEGVVSDAAAKGQDAVDAVRDVGDNMVNAIDESLRKRPYTTLALAVAIGFFFGATWRR